MKKNSNYCDRFKNISLAKALSYNNPINHHHNHTTQIFYLLLLITPFLLFPLPIEAAEGGFFKPDTVKQGIIDPVYKLVKDNVGFVALAGGAAGTFLARGADLWTKATSFAAGAAGTGAALKFAEIILISPAPAVEH